MCDHPSDTVVYYPFLVLVLVLILVLILSFYFSPLNYYFRQEAEKERLSHQRDTQIRADLRETTEDPGGGTRTF